MDRHGHRRFQNVLQVANTVRRMQIFHHELQEVRPTIPRNILRDQLNPLEAYNDVQFRRNFAFTKETFIRVFRIFENELTVYDKQGDTFYLPPMLRLIIFMQYLRSNSFYRCVSTQCVVAVPESTVCRTVNQVAKIIASKMKTYVKLPNIEEQNQIASRIFDQYGFPGIFHVVLNDVFLQKLIIICI